MAAELSKSYEDLRREIGWFIGQSRDPEHWDRELTRNVNDAIVTGLSNFYWYTPPQGVPPHSWSFLKPSALLTTLANTDTYDLPTDFGGFYSEGFTFDSGTQAPIKVVTEEELRTLRGTLAQTATEPQYCAVRPKITNEGIEQIYEVLFYPSPTAAHTLRYRYSVIPGLIDQTNKYPHGSRLHSVTILESCLAAAQRKFLEQEEGGVNHQAEFERCLVASIHRDREFSESDTSARMWPVEDTPEGLELNRSGLTRRVGFQMFTLPNPGSWSADQKAQIEQVVMDGLRKFYYPMVLPPSREMHRWSFLYPSQAFKCTASTYTYELPDDFGSLKGPMHYAPGSAVLYPNVEEVSESQIEQLRQAGDHTGRTRYFAIRPLMHGEFRGTRYEILLYPVPDQAYTLHYRYEVNPRFIVSEKEHPLGGQPHAQTILESCLSCAEMHTQSGSQVHGMEFIKCLQASVSYDRMLAAPDTLGRDYDGSDRPSDQFVNNIHDADLNVVNYTGYSP